MCPVRSVTYVTGRTGPPSLPVHFQANFSPAMSVVSRYARFRRVWSTDTSSVTRRSCCFLALQ
jgi:hypothetical protein